MEVRVEGRRGCPRFDIVGELWGTLDTVVGVPLLDVGRGGARVRCQVPLAPPSVHNLVVDRGGQQVSAGVEVRHAREVIDSRGRASFEIGLDFLSMPAGLLAQIGTWMARTRATAAACRSRTESDERRRMPRTRVWTKELIRLRLQHRVRVLDISQSGALVSSEATLPIGTRSHFRTALGDSPFNAEIEVKRQTDSARCPLVDLGAVFASIDDRSLCHLEQFLLRGRKGESQAGAPLEKHQG